MCQNSSGRGGPAATFSFQILMAFCKLCRRPIARFRPTSWCGRHPGCQLTCPLGLLSCVTLGAMPSSRSTQHCAQNLGSSLHSGWASSEHFKYRAAQGMVSACSRLSTTGNRSVAWPNSPISAPVKSEEDRTMTRMTRD